VKSTEELEQELREVTAEYNAMVANNLVWKARHKLRRINHLEHKLRSAAVDHRL
jgi:hypothetical protein